MKRSTGSGFTPILNPRWEECSCSPPETLGAAPQMHQGAWHARHEGRVYRYLGSALLQGNRTEIAAANDVMGYFDSNPCTKASIPQVASFQQAYNASGLPGSLTVDGQYGPNTQKALQNVIDMAEAGLGPSQAAPANCWAETPPATPAPDAGPTAPATPATPSNTTVVVNPTPMNWTPWIIGGAAVAGGGAIGYAYWKKHRRGHR